MNSNALNSMDVYVLRGKQTTATFSRTRIIQSTPSYPFARTLGHIFDAQYVLVRPITILTELDAAGYLVYDEEEMTYGLGLTIDEATRDYQQSLIIDLELLQKDRDVLSPALCERLMLLEQHIHSSDVLE